MASDNPTPERPATPLAGGAAEQPRRVGSQAAARPMAPGGLRRVLWGFGMGAVLGFLAAVLSPRPHGPRRRT